MIRKGVLLLTIAALLWTGIVFSQGKEKESKFAIGFQDCFPTFGISGMINLDKNLSIQGIVGFLGDLKSYGGRVLYRFTVEDYWNAYAYGMLGAWSYTGFAIDDEWHLTETTETVFGFGGGVGIEYSMQALSPKLPPIFWNLEVGVGSVSFSEVDYDFSAFMLGCGAHFRF
jgi:hypothetical protein